MTFENLNKYPFEMCADVESLTHAVERIYDLAKEHIYDKSLTWKVICNQPSNFPSVKGKNARLIGGEEFVVKDFHCSIKNEIYVELDGGRFSIKVPHNVALDVFDGYEKGIRRLVDLEDEGLLKELNEVAISREEIIESLYEKAMQEVNKEESFDEIVKLEDERFGSW